MSSTHSVAFGPLLRRHRMARGLSQEALADDAEISTRHLSCLERGRAAPSRTMVLVLGSALDLPLRDRNHLLDAAGYSGAYRETSMDAPEAESLRNAVGLILDAVEPNGAVAVDRAWNVIRMNGAAARLFSMFVDLPEAPEAVVRNVMLATLHPMGLRPFIVNFDEVAAFTLERARREKTRYPDDPAVESVRQAVLGIPGLPSGPAPIASAGPFVTVHLKRGDLEARLFTTIATIGTPIDATAEDLRIETYFPADERSRVWLTSLREQA